MPLQKIRLELARCKEFPDGSALHGYEFVAPLSDAGLIDPEAWKHVKSQCTVRRFWGNQPDEKGLLVHTRGKHWVFSYVPETTDDDEPIFKFDRHAFKQGEYVSVTEHDGVQRPFRIVSVD